MENNKATETNLNDLYRIAKRNCGGGGWAYLCARFRLCEIVGVNNAVVDIDVDYDGYFN